MLETTARVPPGCWGGRYQSWGSARLLLLDHSHPGDDTPSFCTPPLAVPGATPDLSFNHSLSTWEAKSRSRVSIWPHHRINSTQSLPAFRVQTCVCAKYMPGSVTCPTGHSALLEVGAFPSHSPTARASPCQLPASLNCLLCAGTLCGSSCDTLTMIL